MKSTSTTEPAPASGTTRHGPAALLVAAFVTLPFGCTSARFSFAEDGGASGVAPTSDAGNPDARSTMEAAPPEDGGVRVTGDLSFGDVACGKSAPSRTVTVENVGDRSFTVTASFARGAASPYALSASTATVAPHAKLAIVVTPSAVPQASAVPGDFGDTLVLRTDVPGDHAHDLAATEGAEGAILSFDTQAIPFGEVPVSSAESSTFHVVNTGNLPATVVLALGMLPDPSFTVTQSAMSVSSGDSLTASATFSPVTTGVESNSVVIVPADGTTLCAPLPPPIALHGVGENGGLTLSTAAIAFGATTCGKQAAPQPLSLTNSGNATLAWSASLANTSPVLYTVSPAMAGSLAAGGSIELTITPGPIPAASSVQANFYGDTLTFNTNVIGDAAHIVTLSETAKGAILAFNPTSVDFGDVPIDTTRTATFQVVNSGNADAQVTVSPSDSTLRASPGGLTVVPKGSQVNFTGTFAPGNSTATTVGMFSVAATGALCAPLPSPLTTSGTGTNGVVSFSPGALSFGDEATTGFTACGTSAAAKTVTFSNSGNQSYTITPKLAAGASSPYTFAIAPTSGVVAAGGGVATITVTPKAIPATSAVPGNYGDTLSVTTTAAGDTAPHVIALTQSAYGAVLTGAPAMISFPGTPVDGQSTMVVGVTNSGNAPAVLTWTAISNPVFSFDQNVTAPPAGVTTSPLAYFSPAAAISYSGTATLGVAATTTLCQPIPATLTMLTGVGTNGSVVSVSPAQVDFNMVACGTSGGSDVVTIKNNGIVSITWSASLPMGSPFALGTPSSGTLASGASAMVTVSSNVVPVSATTTTASNGFGSQLTVTTSAVNDTSHVIPILETASGAILSFSPAALDLPLTSKGMPVAYDVTNAGNVPASVSLALVNPGPATLTLNSPVSGMVSNGTPLQGSVTEDPLSLPASNATVTLTPAAGTVLCQPAPASMTITAN
jgi:hypothetical protein